MTGTVRETAGWRDRRFAPVYALVLAFALAWFLGGLAPTPAPEPTRTTIRFVTGKALPVEGLEGRRVELYPLSGGPLLAGPIRDSALTIRTPDQAYLICVGLEGEWRPAQKDALAQGTGTCWQAKAGQTEVPITLVRTKQ